MTKSIDEQAKGLFAQFWQGLRALVAPEKERALSTGDVFMQVYEQAENRYPMAWLHDIYFDNDGSMFAIFSYDGKLYKTPLTVENDQVVMADWFSVVHEFRPVEMRSKTEIIRQADGRIRWLSISATSVLNRVGEIDSQALFDSFVNHAEKTGEYPYRTFYHRGEAFKTGQGDFLARDENCYITSGLYDDSELARAEAAAIERDPDYWGESIGYVPTLPPELHRVAGVEIPVYRAGINTEISTLPEQEAANLFTLTRTEVQRMLTGKAYDAFVKLMEGDEEKARRWLEENTDETNRAIQDAGMITRAQEKGEPEQLPLMETPPVEVDDALISEIVRQATESESFTGFGQQLNEIVEAVEALNQATEALGKALNDHQQDVTERLAKLERGKVQERAEWAQDLPSKHSIRVVKKSRFDPTQEDEAVKTSTDKANKTLAKLPTYG